MGKTTVHFIDEHGLHYEAIAWKTVDGDLANLYVWARGHIRLINEVPLSPNMTPVSWHPAHLTPNGYSECMSNMGYVFLSDEERETFYRLTSDIKPEQGK